MTPVSVLFLFVFIGILTVAVGFGVDALREIRDELKRHNDREDTR